MEHNLEFSLLIICSNDLTFSHFLSIPRIANSISYSSSFFFVPEPLVLESQSKKNHLAMGTEHIVSVAILQSLL